MFYRQFLTTIHLQNDENNEHFGIKLSRVIFVLYLNDSVRMRV